LDIEVIIETSQTTITPFLEHPQQLPILNKSLDTHQRKTLDSLGITITDKENRNVEKGLVVMKDTVFCTKELMVTFLEESLLSDQPTQCAIKKGAVTQRSTISTMDVDDRGESVGYRLYYYPPGTDHTSSLTPIVIDADEYVQEMMFPNHMVPGKIYKVPLTRKIIFQIEHWTNLWACNIAGLLSNIADLQSNKSQQLRLAVKALSTNQWRVSSKNVQVGKGCDVHPTAYVENSIIGEGVEIGAQSVIRGSMIGDNSVIASNCTIAYSALGDECQLRDGATVTYSLLFPGALTTCPFLNTSVMGRDSFIAVGSVLTDFRFDGKNVTVMKDGKAVDSGQIILSGCLGHNAYVGAGVIVAPGREIPNGARLLPD
jgi:acetyltransferase-like isoleucine patch superfamily enzyme